MKTLLLLRHAKSGWSDANLTDFDRPLNERGRHDAPLIGRLLGKRKIVPDLIISSPAERAKQTILLVTESAGFSIMPHYDAAIYEATVARLLELIAQIEDTSDSVLLVGHNPGLEELLMHLTGDARRMTTASLANIIFDVAAWSQIKEGSGRLQWLLTPQDLMKS